MKITTPSYRPTPQFVAVITIIAALVCIVGWFFWAIEQARADQVPVRAVTAEMHEACASMPRGNQEMENGRIKCFKQLYGAGRVKINR